MILFDLQCAQGHVVEAWFASGADYEAQKARGLLSCPVCDSPDVEKAVTAAAVPAKSNRGPSSAELREAVARLRAAVEASCDDVGPNFAAEARARHRNGDERRGIWGTASLAEVRDLLADEIPVLPLPFRPPGSADA
ncbi:DUF1178 family protein [Thermaurantiacus sp.]